jgi:hypothetical protein
MSCSLSRPDKVQKNNTALTHDMGPWKTSHIDLETGIAVVTLGIPVGILEITPTGHESLADKTDWILLAVLL